MFVDGRSISDGSAVEADVCIVGAGPAGLTVAAELDRRRVRVAVFDAGDVERVPELQDLVAREVEGRVASETEDRRIQLGGNSNSWNILIDRGTRGVRYLPMDPTDLAGHAAPHRLGWPVTIDELQPFYERAHELCLAGPYEYRVGADDVPPPLRLADGRVVSKLFRFGPGAAFHDRLRRRLVTSAHATLYHHAAADELLLDAAGRVQAVRFRHLDGRSFLGRGRAYVLALGGMGNPHLMLLSPQLMEAGGGFDRDLVGRYLMDHPILSGGTLIPTDPTMFDRFAFYDLRRSGGATVMGHLGLSRAALERDDLVNMSALFFPRPSVRRTEALESLREVGDHLRIRQRPPELAHHLRRIAGGADGLPTTAYHRLVHGQAALPWFGRGGWSTRPHAERRFRRFEVLHQAEQLPDPANRVSLSLTERDRIGRRRLSVRWLWSRDDAARAARSRRVFAEALVGAGVGHVELPADDDLPGAGSSVGTAHHLGTTRMATNGDRGVVDGNGTVHGVPNLHVTGSSVFPTGGYANPTLTVVALAARLASWLHESGMDGFGL